MCKFFMVLTCLCFSSLLMAQEGIQTENKLGVEDLVKNVFIKGNCRNVSNITAIGSESLSIGQFENGSEIIKINDGIILSTGTTDLAQGPNIENEAGFPFDIESNDPDLNELATSTLYDATGIEFDFVPIGDRVSFRYVFASEEYCEFVGTAFNDVFGFFVSGPGINGPFDNNAINVATITTLDGTNASVSINNINHLTNETFYVNNITTTDAQNCQIPYVPMFQDFIEYDGFTIALTASFQVIPCETYHIRLVLGDVGDPYLDSAVFLEAKSFDLGAPVNVRAEVPGREDPISYENCVDGQFVFTRGATSNLSEDFTIDYNISADSDALNGVDFAQIPLSVTIPAGESEVILPITVIDDNLVEGAEKIKLELLYDCNCIDPTSSELIINDPVDLAVSMEEIAVCADQIFNITPEVIGGVEPYEFLWETGATTEFFEGNISAPTNYAFTVTDFCGNSNLGIVNVGIQNIPVATIMGNYDLCESQETGIPIQLEGNPPWKITYSIDDVEQDPIENIQINPFFLLTPIEGNYLLTAFNDAYCDGLVMGNALVESTFLLESEVQPPSCFNSTDGSITITQLDAIPPFTTTWNFATENDLLLENLAEGTYTLTIENGEGCLYEKTFELDALSDDIKDCLPIYIPNSFSPNNDGINDFFSIFYSEANGVENINSLQVYNRWGALLYEQRNFSPDDQSNGWNGEYKGRPLNSGVYVYRLMITLEDGSIDFLTGDITLIR